MTLLLLTPCRVWPKPLATTARPRHYCSRPWRQGPICSPGDWSWLTFIRPRAIMRLVGPHSIKSCRKNHIRLRLSIRSRTCKNLTCTSIWPVSYTHLDVYKRQGQRLIKTKAARQIGLAQTVHHNGQGGRGELARYALKTVNQSRLADLRRLVLIEQGKGSGIRIF